MSPIVPIALIELSSPSSVYWVVILRLNKFFLSETVNESYCNSSVANMELPC